MILDNPQHWLYRAKQMRRLADDTPEPKTRRMMLSVAERYDKRAQEKSEATTTIAAAKTLG
jgi:aromatic ring hydroxylase